MKRLIPSSILESFQRNKYSGEFTAATMFIDISGFTSMTQTLMKNGKEGAEILTSIINNIFTPAIDAIYDNKGFISVFAGDAFTAIFPIEITNPFTAVIAACKIQKTFKEIGLQNSKFGDFQLYVKVGLSYGNVKWGLIRNEIQNVYYFRGDAINNCAYSEHQCTTGDTVFDDKMHSVLQDNLLKIQYKKKSEKYFLINQITEKIAQSSVKMEKYSGKDLNKFVPQVILDRKLKGEFRDVISAFLSFEETEDMHAGISDIISIANEYGGYFNKVDFGDKGAVALIFFGAPIGREKLNERACDFGLKAQEMASKRKINLRMGLTHGKVFAGFIGSDLRCEYSALGVTVNLSARFMMKAKWQEIFIDRRVLENVETMYENDFLSEQDFKGFSEKIPVYRLTGKKEKYQAKTFEGEMVGRTGELQKLKKMLDPIKTGKFGGIVYVDGIAGIGKSRLINEMKEQILSENYHWYYLPCDEILRKSFNPFTYFLNNFFNQSENNSKAGNKEEFETCFSSLVDSVENLTIQPELQGAKTFLGAQLGLYWEDSLYEQLDSKSRYTNTLYAVKNLFKALSLLKPVIIELDDGHWIDKDSMNMLAVLTHNISESPIIIISACRYNDDESQFSFDLQEVLEKRLELSYLDEQLTKYLTKAKLEDTFDAKIIKLPEELHNFIWEKSSGNPFYIEQLVLYLYYHKILDDEFNLKRTNIEIPSNINAIIVARIDRLAEEVKEVIKTASVIGKEFVVKILSTMLNSLSIEFKSDKLQNVIDTGKSENIWNSIQEIKYIFKHALIRESVYEIQLKERLRELHKLAAETIENIYQENIDEYAEELAFHFERAEEHEKAIQYLEIAGNKSIKNYQNQKALDLLLRNVTQLNLILNTENVTDLIPSTENITYLEKYVENYQHLNHLYQLFGQNKLAEDILNKALIISKKLNNQERIGKVYFDYANYLSFLGKLDLAIENLKEAEKIFIILKDDRLIAGIYRSYGIIYMRKGNSEKALECFNKELGIFNKNIKEKIRYVDALGNFAVMNRFLGNMDIALEKLEEQLKIAEEEKYKMQIARALTNLGWVYEGLEKFEESIEFYKKALVIFRELGIKGELVKILDNMGFTFQQLKEFEKARKLHHNSMEIAQEIDDKESIVNILANLGHACAGDKKYRSAYHYYDDGIILAKKFGFKFSLAEIQVRKAELLYDEHKISEAKKLNGKGLKLAEELNYTKYINLAKQLAEKL